MRQKTKQTHGVKKVSGEEIPPVKPVEKSPAGELIPPTNDGVLLFGPGGITAARPDFMEKVTGLKEAQLRHIAADGFFPATVKRKFNITATVTGVIKCLLTRADRRKEKELPDLPSMDAAEGSGLFTKKFLQTLKSAGCAGFHPSGRIELSRLLPAIEGWLSGDNQKDKLDLQREGVANWGSYREKYQGKSEKLKFEELDGKLIDAEVAWQTGLAAQSIYFGMLDRLTVDLPGRLAGRTAAEIKIEVDKAMGNIRKAVQKEFESARKKSDAQLETLRKQDELVKV